MVLLERGGLFFPPWWLCVDGRIGGYRVVGEVRGWVWCEYEEFEGHGDSQGLPCSRPRACRQNAGDSAGRI